MGHKSSKNSTLNCEPLNRETIEELCLDTGFTEEELLNWHTNFYKDCPDGKLTLKQFEQAYAKIMGKPTQKTADYIRHMFNVYDQDKNQFIDFKEFVMALSAASVVNRLRLVETLFHVFDLDNDGKITKDEIGKMLHTLVDVTNSNQKRRNQQHHHHQQQQQTQDNKQINLQNRIDDAFNELNTNDDDHITKDEFIEWYMKSGLISDVQTNEIDVSDSSRLQEISRKSRKLMKQTSHNRIDHEQDDTHHRNPSTNRYISRMIERKPSTKFQGVDDDDDDDDDEDNNNEYSNRKATTMSTLNTNKPKKHLIINTDDNDSHTSKENERWQYLFNSVLGQIRSQRSREQQPLSQENVQNDFSSWKNDAEEKTKVEYHKQKSNGQFSTHNNRIQPATTVVYEPSSNPDIVTVRL